MRFARRVVVAVAALSTACCERTDRQVVTVFHAASLSGCLSELERQVESKSDVDLRLEPSGSQVAARKVAELHRRADLVLVADWRVIDRILVPEWADWLVQFASNEIVLVHLQHSPHTDRVTADNWPELLTRDGVRLGRADERTAPLGYQTLMVWRLAELTNPALAGPPSLAQRLKARCRPHHVVPDVAELVSLLQSRAIDYAFLFRSIAEEHNLKLTALPAEINLSRLENAADYARARVPVALSAPRRNAELTAAPIIYGLTVPKAAPHRRAALSVVATLLGPEGQRILRRFGFSPFAIAQSPQPQNLPAVLGGLVRPAEP